MCGLRSSLGREAATATLASVLSPPPAGSVVQTDLCTSMPYPLSPAATGTEANSKNFLALSGQPHTSTATLGRWLGPFLCCIPATQFSPMAHSPPRA